jgi:hypothetical protein
MEDIIIGPGLGVSYFLSAPAFASLFTNEAG